MARRVAAAPDSRAAYALWADTYPASAHNPLMRLEQEIVEPILARLHPRRALDVGTGSGRYLDVLARSGAKQVVGVDFSMPMLRAGGTTDHPYRVCADALDLPFQARSFDLVNASLTVGDVIDLQAWLREIARVLQRGGQIVYSDFHPSWTEHGWKRTFRTRDGEAHELPFMSHTIDEHLAAIARAGLRSVAIREPRFRGDADPGVRAFRRRWADPPVVVVFHAVNDL